jgi:hypothetical protein
LSVVIVFPSLFTEGQALADIIKKTAVGITNVNVEYNCIICEARDVVKLASELAGMYGIDRVAIANKVSTNFSEVTSAIVEVGSKVMIPGDRFYVKVILLRPAAAARDYVGRDIEFAASGTLAARLASIKALPAKTESAASRLILAVLGKESAYVCIQVITAPGGSVVGSRGKALSSIHSPLSYLACLTAAKAGLDCSTIVLPYGNESELVNNARLVQLFATKTRRKRQKILAMPINVPAKGKVSSLLKEKIISKILVECQNNRIVFPLTVAIHPIWFLEPIIKETVLAGKMPFAPLLFLSSELDKYAKEAKIELNGSAVKVAKSMFEKYNDRIDSEVRIALKRMKKLELKIGPNYLHDIIDSI